MTVVRKMKLRARCLHQEQTAVRAIAQYGRLKPSEVLLQIVREAGKAGSLWPPSEEAEIRKEK